MSFISGFTHLAQVIKVDPPAFVPLGHIREFVCYHLVMAALKAFPVAIKGVFHPEQVPAAINTTMIMPSVSVCYRECVSHI
jgi:hypothetical protein